MKEEKEYVNYGIFALEYLRGIIKDAYRLQEECSSIEDCFDYVKRVDYFQEALDSIESDVIKDKYHQYLGVIKTTYDYCKETIEEENMVYKETRDKIVKLFVSKYGIPLNQIGLTIKDLLGGE